MARSAASFFSPSFRDGPRLKCRWDTSRTEFTFRLGARMNRSCYSGKPADKTAGRATRKHDGAASQLPDSAIWRMRTAAKTSMVEYARLRYARQAAATGQSSSEIENAGRVLNSEALTLGFARRSLPIRDLICCSAMPHVWRELSETRSCPSNW